MGAGGRGLPFLCRAVCDMGGVGRKVLEAGRSVFLSVGLLLSVCWVRRPVWCFGRVSAGGGFGSPEEVSDRVVPSSLMASAASNSSSLVQILLLPTVRLIEKRVVCPPRFLHSLLEYPIKVYPIFNH